MTAAAPTARPPIDRLLRPRSIAVVGATERPGYASRLMRNLIAGSYDGAIHPVSLTRDDVFGHPASRSLADVPGDVDVVLVVVPADAVPDVVHDCGRVGAAAAVVVSSGFGEAGPEGRRRRDALRAAAGRSGVLVLGPNCNGYASAAAGVWASTFSGLDPTAAKPAVPAVLLSQSGATAFGAGHERAQDLGFSFQAVFSTGNEEVVTSERLAAELLTGDTQVVAVVCEEIHDGPALLRAAQTARERGRQLVMLKIGRSEPGRAAAATHTAALAGDDAVIDDVLRQHGIVRVDDVGELVECVRYLVSAPPPRGRKAIVLSHSGGLGSLAADALGTQGFELPALSSAAERRIDEALGNAGSRHNPLDVTMRLREPVVADVVEALLGDAPDLLTVVTAGDTALAARVAAGVRRAGSDTSVSLVWTGGVRTGGDLSALDVSEIPWFTGAGSAAKVLARCRDAEAACALAPAVPDGHLRARRRDGAGVRTLDEVEGKDRLRAVDVPLPDAVVAADVDDVVEAAGSLAPPWVLKVSSPEVLHKAAAGLLLLGIADLDHLRRAATRLATTAEPLTRWRFLLERHHAVRAELYVGCTIDAHVGPVLGVGRGGGDVEVDGHVVWGTCPLDDAAARRALEDDRLRRWIDARGVTVASRDRLAALVARLSRFFVEADDVHELELNPVAVGADGLPVVLDAVLRVGRGLTEPAARLAPAVRRAPAGRLAD